ncbi:MAG TPA: hypothetical protein VG755_32595 [Nannocystaceae bacterium]|nr:hypothetical protein [Nannocystaceae bacterium]
MCTIACSHRGDGGGGDESSSGESSGSSTTEVDASSSSESGAPACVDLDLGEEIGPALARGTTEGAGHDLAISCGDADDVVYRWRAPQAGRFAFDLAGSSFDTAIAVLAADCTGTELACNDDGIGKQSRVIIDAEADDELAIVIAGSKGQAGAYVLGIAMDDGVDDSCIDVDLASRTGVSVALGSTAGRGDEVSPSCAVSGADVLHHWTAPAAGNYSFAVPSGTAAIALFEDDCDGAEIACVPSFEAPYGANAMLDAGESIVIAVDDGGVAASYSLDIFALGGGACIEGDLGSVVGQAVASGSTVGHGDDVPVQGCAGGAEDVAYTWTAPYAGTWVFDLAGSSYDTVLALRDGSCGGVELACNDDAAGSASQLAMSLASGQTIAIVIDGYGSSDGSYVLSIASGDGPTSCIDYDLGMSGGPLVASTDGALDEVTPSCAAFGSGSDVEVQWTAPISMHGTATLTASPGATLSRLSACGGAELGCSGDDGTGTMQLEFDALAGEQLLFVVDGGPFGGGFELLIE